MERCIKSICKNNAKYIKEIVIVNDASNDNTEHVVKKLKREIPFYYYKKNFKNLSKTMNFAINKCKGKIICKIDPDDEIKKKLAEILGKKFLNSNVDFLYSNVIVNDTKRKKKYVKKQKISKFFNLFQYPHGSGCLITKKLWKKVGGFNELNFFQDDFDFWIRINKLKKSEY